MRSVEREFWNTKSGESRHAESAREKAKGKEGRGGMWARLGERRPQRTRQDRDSEPREEPVLPEPALADDPLNTVGFAI